MGCSKVVRKFPFGNFLLSVYKNEIHVLFFMNLLEQFYSMCADRTRRKNKSVNHRLHYDLEAMICYALQSNDMIYLDNAATTFVWAAAVEQAVRRAMYGAAGWHEAATRQPVERRVAPAGSRQRRAVRRGRAGAPAFTLNATCAEYCGKCSGCAGFPRH